MSPINDEFKSVVRDRVAATGEKYNVARQVVQMATPAGLLAELATTLDRRHVLVVTTTLAEVRAQQDLGHGLLFDPTSTPAVERPDVQPDAVDRQLDTLGFVRLGTWRQAGPGGWRAPVRQVVEYQVRMVAYDPPEDAHTLDYMVQVTVLAGVETVHRVWADDVDERSLDKALRGLGLYTPAGWEWSDSNRQATCTARERIVPPPPRPAPEPCELCQEPEECGCQVYGPPGPDGCDACGDTGEIVRDHCCGCQSEDGCLCPQPRYVLV